MTLRLRYSPLSPYVRKVLVCAIETGLRDQIELEQADVWSPDTDIFKDNPVGKIPAMATPDGTFAGSFACCDYLDHLNKGAPLIPREGPARWRVMQMQALADGAMEAALGIVIETVRRPKDVQWDANVARQTDKLVRTLEALEARRNDLAGIDLAAITTGVLLGYVDYRVKTLEWRASAPKLAAWYAEFSKRPSMESTAPK